MTEFYDGWVERQVAAGTNERHHLILDLARVHGLRSNMRVLEVGCGIGTLTALLLARLKKGRLLAIDISSSSIAEARSRLGTSPVLELRTADIVREVPEERFDMIVLPDVLEHIPPGDHPRLFANLARCLEPNGRILIHSPDPHYADHLRATRPELLQVVDLALHLPPLLNVIEEAGLAMHHFQRHSIWTIPPDYMALVLVHSPKGSAYGPGIHAGRLRARMGRWFKSWSYR